MASAAQLARLAQALTEVRMVSYSNGMTYLPFGVPSVTQNPLSLASALAFLSYDILITLSEEVRRCSSPPSVLAVDFCG